MSVIDHYRELQHAVVEIPAEVGQWWHDAYRWDRPRGEYQIVPDGNHQSLIFVPDPEYRAWVWLGRASDALLILLVLAIIALAAGAF